VTFEEKYKHLPSLPRIVCAANKIPTNDGDLILIGARHWDTLMRNQFHAQVGLFKEVYKNQETQGFIDQFGRFYDRKEAKIIAEHNNQIIRVVGGDSEKLYSENLY